MNSKIKQLKARLILETKQSNSFRLSRNKAKTTREHKAWQTLIDLADKSKDRLRKQISDLEKGLKAPVTKGLTTLCAMSVGVTGRRKKDGSQKKGYIAKKGGRMVKKTTKTRKVKL